MALREEATVFGHMLTTHYISSLSWFWEYIIMYNTLEESARYGGLRYYKSNLHSKLWSY